METRDPRLLQLFEAYQMAVEARDAIRKRRFDWKLVREYDETCFEIEKHVIRAIHEPPLANRQKAGEPS